MRLALALGGISQVPVRLRDFEQGAIGERFGPEVVEAARSAAIALGADDEGEYPGTYRTRLAGVLTARALQQAHARIPSRQ
jgi:CO/xanthine dehydrogenase FAD-binding subunit